MVLTIVRRRLYALLTSPKYFWPFASLVIFGDAVLTQLIIRFISYTEIDWETYMVQVAVYLKGEMDYSKISGPTGPLVYPVGHLYIHQFLFKITDAGQNLWLAQQIYAALYLTTLFLSCVIYRRAGAPNWLLVFLPLSKRLHSIFVLRLFNDCWTLVPMQLAVLAFQGGLDHFGILLYSLALSVKMSALVYLPGLLVIFYKRRGLLTTAHLVSIILASQVLLAWPFVQHDAWAYIRSAFDLSRVFLYEWTVNWRFVRESAFLSPTFARTLLLGHVVTLIAFGHLQWCSADGGAWKTILRGLSKPTLPAGLVKMSARDVTLILFTSNLIGILFARSLHYQFYSWYAQQIPLLAWATPNLWLVKFALMANVEWAWNTFPSTRRSSGVLLACHIFLLTGIWAAERLKNTSTRG
ncbi:dolichyl-P-Man:Man(5)GlcNAc(2)-PP-dolichyl mannosyltransferase [Pluteus cervinus]|uniref:Dolichyl-P-Man:Man(5)GlcNAc(2)-PP-dolichyl mannosyltransferase n=1 Tax=Pluteus cervinus TaxID=181527 RepID=A0ACD3B5C1_9AGAR|nr:dolichyl-P-Man:Man(5)GlcNAc(2)-PP-dolichyl mannosyltransferase [Pluteus cervinus]